MAQAVAAERVSLIADTDATGTFTNFDAITRDNFSQRLLLTAETKSPNSRLGAFPGC